MDIEKKMYDMAVELIKKRYPVGWGGACVIRSDKDNYFTSVAIDVCNSSADLCIETGAICEAHKFQEKVTHCICVVRDNENSKFKVLSPCGLCQERLRFWGGEVLVGVTGKDRFIKLDELQPYHWTKAYTDCELDYYE